MRTATVDIQVRDARDVTTTDDTLTTDLSGGCTMSLPLVWHTRLALTSYNERD